MEPFILCFSPPPHTHSFPTHCQPFRIDHTRKPKSNRPILLLLYDYNNRILNAFLYLPSLYLCENLSEFFFPGYRSSPDSSLFVCFINHCLGSNSSSYPSSSFLLLIIPTGKIIFNKANRHKVLQGNSFSCWAFCHLVWGPSLSCLYWKLFTPLY